MLEANELRFWESRTGLFVEVQDHVDAKNDRECHFTSDMLSMRCQSQPEMKGQETDIIVSRPIFGLSRFHRLWPFHIASFTSVPTLKHPSLEITTAKTE